MSRLTDLIAQAKARDPQMGADLESEFKALSSRRSFGLNFERHRPETVELASRPVRKGDKVRILPARGETTKADQRLWQVKSIHKKAEQWLAKLAELYADVPELKEVLIDDLVVVAEFKDKIYPGLVSTGKVERGGDKPFHSVINGENFHALKALTYTHRGKVDAIYIDPPYNTGAKDWKYNNHYVESEDLYRHSKWLAFMERRLRLAKDLLNPQSSMLIVTIDEKEYLRLGLLLEQLFPSSKIQMITSVINPKGVARGQEFYRVEEYLFFVFIGDMKIAKSQDPMILTGTKAQKQESEGDIDAGSSKSKKVRWGNLLRSGTDARRVDRKNQFYPIFLFKDSGKLHSVGESLLPISKSRDEIQPPEGTIAVWPIRKDGSEGRWQVSRERFIELFNLGYATIGKLNKKGRASFSYLTEKLIKQIEDGEIEIIDKDEDGGVIVEFCDEADLTENPKTMWNKPSHSGSDYGSSLIREILPGRHFPFPKSLYAVEDTLRFVLKENKRATVLDFFSGSGTTAHAVFRLNREDGGSRQAICITNNEVAANEQTSLRKIGLRPGDAEWEKYGICDFITKPRLKSSITGLTPEGKKIKGDYRFNCEFPISDGFKENAEFFTLTYESPLAVTHNLAFERIAPLLWLKAGSVGKRIDTVPVNGWEVVEAYGVLVDLDKSRAFSQQLTDTPTCKLAYIVTNDDRRFQAVVRILPEGVEPVRLYESYLNNFQFANGD
ncbi:site-specific DNA-methyltransferase [Pseudidiomarina terrestris]|uniref:site-specific DNA-methyltransferase n=1 Tax=Pseudidiomarina terrestris TaxID=2820060 RepID=UPI00264A5387|nr:DNA methyltransferase [Pseudidiomarina sp. 1ASP75-5]MDN7136382.1 site-specific DNA-methyltransferase [Pseudidiomarina sp. 1ASP75-5]